MNRPTLTEGIVVAASLAFCAVPLQSLLPLFFDPSSVIALTCILLALAYECYLLSLSPRRVGRISLFAVSVLALGGAVAAGVAGSRLIALSAGAVWTIRILSGRYRPLAAMADALLVLAGSGSGLWAYANSGSLTAAVWCFFLAQAPFASLRRWLSPAMGQETPDANCDRFARAYRCAQTALEAWQWGPRR